MTNKAAFPAHNLKGILIGFLVALLSIFSGTVANGQGWGKAFGGDKLDQGEAIIQTVDGGYVVAGFSESLGSDNDMDVYIVRTDIDGTLCWEKVIDEAFIERAYQIIPTNDNGFLLVGDIISNAGSSSDAYVLKIDGDGNLLWSKQYGEIDKREKANDVVATPDGGYLLVGVTDDTESGKDDILLKKLDAEGNELWTKIFGDIDDDEGFAIASLPENKGYALVGSADSPSLSADNDIVLYKVDADGNEEWSKRIDYVENQNDEGSDVIITKAGDIGIVGYVKNNSDVYLAKYSEDGNFLWDTTIGEEGKPEQGFELKELEDESLIIVGIKEVTGANIDVFLAKTNKDGEEIWSRVLGSEEKTDFGTSVIPTSDSGFMVTGFNGEILSFFTDLAMIKTDSEGNTLSNLIEGNIFHDIFEDCNYNGSTDNFLKEWLVRVEGESTVRFGTSDEDGYFSVLVDTGSYRVEILPPNSYWEACVEEFNVTFNEFYDTTTVQFAMQAGIVCPYLEVDISAPFLTDCSNIPYTVSYCNLGTGVAEDATVEVVLDSELTFVSSGIPFAFNQDSLYRFNLGDIAIGECSAFVINTTLNCDGIAPSQAGMASAQIYPDTLCYEPDPNWDESSIIVGGQCQEDGSILFDIKNVGQGDMTEELDYFIVEDDLMFLRQSFQLGSGQTEMRNIPTTEGKTYRIVAQQSMAHPGNSNPTIAIEGCRVNEDDGYSTGYVTQFPENDQDPFIEIDVQEILVSEDPVPNDSTIAVLRGYPKGYRTSIIAQNTDITYKILFRNIGTDPINRAVIRDTLSQFLDVSSLEIGASSHPYTYEVYDSGILKITFSDIQLNPGSSAEEAQAYGFIEFRIAQKPENPVGTIIKNGAALFLDYQAPVNTNVVSHQIERFPNYVELSVKTGEVFLPDLKIKIYPNPFNEATTFELIGSTSFNQLQLKVFDANGRLIRIDSYEGNQFNVYRNQLTSGLYFYQLESEGQLISNGKILVR